jgi:hypothetical protein
MILVGRPVCMELLGKLCIDGKILIKWILKKLCVRLCFGYNWLRAGFSDSLSQTQ